jgi:hypothetical protein
LADFHCPQIDASREFAQCPSGFVNRVAVGGRFGSNRLRQEIDERSIVWQRVTQVCV